MACGVVGADAELVLCPGKQPGHSVGEGVAVLRGRLSEQHLTEAAEGNQSISSKTLIIRLGKGQINSEPERKLMDEWRIYHLFSDVILKSCL